MKKDFLHTHVIVLDFESTLNARLECKEMNETIRLKISLTMNDVEILRDAIVKSKK